MLAPIRLALVAWVCLAGSLWAEEAQLLNAGGSQAGISLLRDGNLRTYKLATKIALRDNQPPNGQITFSEPAGHATIRTGNLMFDGLYAMAVSEALENSVSQRR